MKIFVFLAVLVLAMALAGAGEEEPVKRSLSFKASGISNGNAFIMDYNLVSLVFFL